MNEMYTMGLGLHSLGAGAMLLVIFVNLFALISAKDLKKYRRLHALYLNPLVITVLGALLFTGVIMMAAKHLEFSFANIVMIVVGIVLIVLEAKRGRALKHLSAKKEHALYLYKPFARTLLQIEFILVLVLSLWMWLL